MIHQDAKKRPRQRPRLLIVGDATAPTGYARVLESVLRPLAGRYDLHHLATRYDGGEHDLPWELRPAADETGPYGFGRIAGMVDELDPDLVFLLYDLPFQRRYLEALRAAAKRPPVVVYSPIESGPLEPEHLQPLAGVAAYVVFSRYAAGLVRQGLERLAEAGGDAGPPVPRVIPHGVDSGTFRPLADDPAEAVVRARRELLRSDEHDGDFIVLNANRNLPKKRLDVTLRGFARFARDKPANVRLYLHTQPQGQGWNVALLARRWGILDRLILTTDEDRHPAVSTDQLNLIYNASDVGLNTSTNEAWGLVSFEHAATRRAQVVPGHSCLPELWGDAALLVEPETTFVNLREHADSWLLPADGVARALERLYADRELRREMADRAYARATAPELAWSAIAERFDALFREILGSGR